MSHITPEQLQHLAKLCRIELTPEDKEKLLPQLEQIIEFVGQLQECDVSDIEPATHIQDDVTLSCNDAVMDCDKTEQFLANVKHPIVEQAIQVTNKLSEVQSCKN